MQAVIFSVCSLILIAALLWLFLPRSVVEIPAADAEDREQLGFFSDPEALWDIIGEINAVMGGRHIQIGELDAAIRVLAKRGHVIMAPSREDIEQASALLEARIIP